VDDDCDGVLDCPECPCPHAAGLAAARVTPVEGLGVPKDTIRKIPRYYYSYLLQKYTEQQRTSDMRARIWDSLLKAVGIRTCEACTRENNSIIKTTSHPRKPPPPTVMKYINVDRIVVPQRPKGCCSPDCQQYCSLLDRARCVSDDAVAFSRKNSRPLTIILLPLGFITLLASGRSLRGKRASQITKTLLLLTAMSALCFQSQAVYANIGVPGQYQTIQEALNAAGQGDTIEVAPGTYHEVLEWPQTTGITLRSSGGSASTIIDAHGVQSVIQIRYAGDLNAIIDGLPLKVEETH